MFHKAAPFLCILPALVAAQYGYGGNGQDPPSSSSTTEAAAQSAPSAPADTSGNINIDVAFNNEFIFNPSNITAPNGTLVTFWFPDSDLSHSVTQSSFANPCSYLEANGSSPAGFDSGLQTGKQFTIQVIDDAEPIWFFCKQITHCGMGFVGSINAPSTGNTFEAFQSAARNLGLSAPTESDNGPVTGGVNGVATATPAATASSTGSSDPGSDGAIGLGVNAGFALGLSAVVAAIISF